MKKLFPGIFSHKGRIITKNLVPGKQVYGERLYSFSTGEYREWVAHRSKLAAGIRNGLKEIPFGVGSNVLYLGIAEGTTASHISDVIEERGLIFGVDLSERTMKKLLSICENRKNILPILADANKPGEYADELSGFSIDFLFQDVAQKNQAEIFNKNARFLKKGGKGMISVKAQSVSSTIESTKVFADQEKILTEKFNVLQAINLKPFEKEHMLYLVEKK